MKFSSRKKDSKYTGISNNTLLDLFKKDVVIILGLSVMFFLLFLILSSQTKMLLWDENVYLSNARSHYSQSNYVEDFRYPGIEYVINALWTITGENIFVIKLLMILFATMSIVLVYLFSRIYLPKQHSIFSSMILGISSIMLFWSFRIYTDMIGLFLSLLGMYLFILFINKKLSAKYYFLIGVICALVFLIRFTYGMLLGAILLYLFMEFLLLLFRTYVRSSTVVNNNTKHTSRKSSFNLISFVKNSFNSSKPILYILLFVLLGFILALLPWMLFNINHYNNPL